MQKQKQIHKRLTTDQVKTILQGYCVGTISLHDALEILGIKRSRFFDFLRSYRQSPETFKIDYQRRSPSRIDERWEKKIIKALKRQQQLIANPKVQITNHNYSYLRDRLRFQKVYVSKSTIISRAKEAGFYKPQHKKQTVHDREVITTAIGALIQHDASNHLWSPYAAEDEKWTLITSIDDYSRLMLYADFVPKETTWAHINAAKELMLKYGIPLRYYVDQLRVFRFITHQNSIWVEQRAKTDSVNTKWKKVVNSLGVEVIYAETPQAKGKVERPYRWLQDRIIRTCAEEHISRIDEAREVLNHEINQYNTEKIHSITKEIPMARFEQAKRDGKTLFRPLELPKPYQNLDDIFCLIETRTTDGYRRIYLENQQIQLLNVPPYEKVSVHMTPKEKQNQNVLEIRIWWKDQLVYHSTYPMIMFPKVHF